MNEKKRIEYIARGVRFDTDVWAALKVLKQQFGSYNKGLREKLLKEPKRKKGGDERHWSDGN